MNRINNYHERVKISKETLKNSRIQDFPDIVEELLNVVNEATEGNVEEVLHSAKYKYIISERAKKW